MPIIVEQINVNLILDTYNSNNKKVGMNEIKMDDFEISVRCSNRARSITEISGQKKHMRVQTREKMMKRKMSLELFFLEKES